MLQEQIIEEIKQAPNDKLVEAYNLIYYFCLGITEEKYNQKLSIKQRLISLSKENILARYFFMSEGFYYFFALCFFLP